MSKRTLLRIALLLAVIGVFAWKRFTAAPADGGGARAPAAAAIPTNAREFKLGALTFKACDLPQKDSGATTAAYCAPFSVAENRDAPGGRKIDLNLALIKAETERADSDIVVFLAGGPGQAAVEAYPIVAGSMAPLRKHHHILLLDQRGTGKSHPLDCTAVEEAEKHPDHSDETGSGIDPQKTRELMTKCLAEVEKKADPRYYTTTVAARDLEDLRQALGAPQFDLVGVSYGTRMAQQYLLRYPDGVRSVVLDSVAPNELVFGQEFARNLEDSLKAQFAGCGKNAACAKAFGDSYASLKQLRDKLRTQPEKYALRDPTTFQFNDIRMSANRLIGLVRMFAYKPETAALLPLSIAEGLKGNYAPLAGQSQLLLNDMSGTMNGGMSASVICAEDAALIKPDPNDADTLLGTTLTDGIAAQCAVWPHGAMPADFHAPLKSDKPILVLGGEFDPVTPPRYGEQVMKGFSNAKLIVARGQGHGVMGLGCIPKLVGEFVEKLDAKTLDAKCVDALGPTPALINFNGAAP